MSDDELLEYAVAHGGHGHLAFLGAIAALAFGGVALLVGDLGGIFVGLAIAYASFVEVVRSARRMRSPNSPGRILLTDPERILVVRVTRWGIWISDLHRTLRLWVLRDDRARLVELLQRRCPYATFDIRHVPVARLVEEHSRLDVSKRAALPDARVVRLGDAVKPLLATRPRVEGSLEERRKIRLLRAAIADGELRVIDLNLVVGGLLGVFCVLVAATGGWLAPVVVVACGGAGYLAVRLARRRQPFRPAALLLTEPRCITHVHVGSDGVWIHAGPDRDRLLIESRELALLVDVLRERCPNATFSES